VYQKHLAPFAIAAAICSGHALADAPRDSYFLLGVGYTQPDDGRAATYGLGGTVGYAHRVGRGLWAEGRVLANVLEADAPGADAYSQQGLGVDALYAFGAAAAWQPFLLLGGGALNNDVTPDALDGSSTFVNAGAGLRSGPHGALRYRGELRAISDTFGDGQLDVLLGFVVELGAAPAAAPVAAQAQPEPTRLVRIERPVIAEPTIADADADGIPDESDQCAQTLAGAKVEPDGCVWAEQVVTLNNIRFTPGSAKLTADSLVKLDSVVGFFANQSDVTMDVYGHTDSQGAERYNQQLSTERAASVRSYLVRKGIVAQRLKSEGFGEAKPIDDNATEQGRARNRRVELHIHARQPR
jgi:OOP family OmpA-OmpF porin